MLRVTMDSEHQATDWYVRRMPSPPRISIPPPAMNTSQKIPEPAEAWKDIVQGLDLQQIWSIDEPLEWTYESRRQPQSILPFLYLGPMTAAKDRSFLETHGITMVLAVRHLQTFEARMIQGGLKFAQGMGLEVASLDVSSPQDLIAAFPRATELINHHLLRRKAQGLGSSSGQVHSNSALFPGKVLVYCESGNERSAAVVIAYLLEVLNADLVQTIQMVQGRRFCINVDDPMRHLLRTYEDLIKAKAEVYRANPLQQSPNRWDSPSTKRGLESEEDSGNEMEVTDIERFRDRTHVPFKDRD